MEINFKKLQTKVLFEKNTLCLICKILVIITNELVTENVFNSGTHVTSRIWHRWARSCMEGRPWIRRRWWASTGPSPTFGCRREDRNRTHRNLRRTCRTGRWCSRAADTVRRRIWSNTEVPGCRWCSTIRAKQSSDPRHRPHRKNRVSCRLPTNRQTRSKRTVRSFWQFPKKFLPQQMVFVHTLNLLEHSYCSGRPEPGSVAVGAITDQP